MAEKWPAGGRRCSFNVEVPNFFCTWLWHSVFTAPPTPPLAGLPPPRAQTYDVSRTTVTRTNYEEDFATAFKLLSMQGAKFDNDKYL